MKNAFGTVEFAKLVFEKVFQIDIDRLLTLADAWKHRRAPVPLDFASIKAEADAAGYEDLDKVAALLANDQPVWSLHENFVVFTDSINRLSKRLVDLQNRDLGGSKSILTFDKDDDDTLDFVSAAANLRSIIFGIETKSKFDIKQMSGNIIPAIATTNAIVAGLVVTQAFKVLSNDLTHAKMVYVSQPPSRMLSSGALLPANRDCAVCGVARASIEVDITKLTLGQFIDDVLKEKLSYTDEISVMTSKLLYDVEFDDNLDKTFEQLGIQDGSFITVMDEDEPEDGSTARVNLEFLVLTKEFSSEPAYTLEAISGIPRKPRPEAAESDSDENMVVPASTKRKADEIVETSNGNKKAKTETSGTSETIVLDDEDGTFLID